MRCDLPRRRAAPYPCPTGLARRLLHALLPALAAGVLLARGAYATSPLAQSAASAIPAPEAAPPVSSLQEQALQAAGRAQEYLRGQSLTVGLGWSQDFFRLYSTSKIERPGPELATVTDNGALAPSVQYDSQEFGLATLPLRTGALALGYNFIFTYSTFSVNRETVDNPFVGEDRGTRVSGDFALAGPMLFARLGPLYPESELFWRLGGGAGAALMRYSGTVEIRQGEHFGEVIRVSDQANRLRLFTALLWELQFSRWLLTFRSMAIIASGGDAVAGLERHSLSLAYNFRF